MPRLRFSKGFILVKFDRKIKEIQVILKKNFLSKIAYEIKHYIWKTMIIPGHPAELSDSIKLLPTDAKSYVFEIDFVLKSICWRFLCQNFIHFGQVVCLQHGFELKAFISGLSRFSNKSQELCRLTTQFFLNQQAKKGLNQWCFLSSLKRLSAYLSFEINLASKAWISKEKKKIKANKILHFWWKICHMGKYSCHFKFI